MMTNARNIQLHISFNGMSKSECEVEILKAFNSTVHLSFQNPRNTPVKVTMDEAEISSLHVSQNIPQNSPMEVSMSAAKNNQIHLSQAVPMNSPLTWKLEGDVESNQIEVSQNAADDNSPLDCTPECPQEEYVYDYQYADAGHDASNQIEEVKDISTNQIEEEDLPRRQETVQVEENYDYTDYQQEWEQSVGKSRMWSSSRKPRVRGWKMMELVSLNCVLEETWRLVWMFVLESLGQKCLVFVLGVAGKDVLE
eukprot:TRINITY_DN4010_c0_g1_i1.p1 TRINITY_DN4010_c0_g1~~TRINITY_DN4010_c0_g1_i1.p1  ORF type:complete len:253 (-),score=74.23 TRINITY_DN4010_c0_g1_i1:160-918(-)